MTDHLATGDIDVTYGNLPEGTDASVDKTVELMVEMAKGKFGARSPKIRAAAINIINGVDPISGKMIGLPVANKDYYGMLEAIHNYVRDNIRYVKDVIGQETLSYPEEILFNSRGEDCDGMTILEIALLGSIGLKAYPVVIGLAPGTFSHVYLYAEIPEGRHRNAGKTFAADPIMREWPLGKEAPADRVKNKRTYPQLAGLGNMSLRGYAHAPSYFSPLDEQEAAQVPAVMKSRYVDTGSRGEIINTKRLTEWGDELDDMFDRANTTQFPMQAAPAYDLYNRGPVTNRAEKVMTSYLHEAHPAHRISAPFGTPIRGPKVVTVGDRAPAKPKQGAPTVGELMGLSDYLSDIAPVAKAASRRHLVNGKNDILHRAAAAALYTKQRAKKASGRVVRMQHSDGFLFGLGDLDADRQLRAAREIESLAHNIAAYAQQIANDCAGDSPARQSVLQQTMGRLEHMDCHLGVIDALAEIPADAPPRVDAQERIASLTAIAHSKNFQDASEVKASPVPLEERRRNPIAGVLPGGAVVRDERGNVVYQDDGSDDGLAGWFSKIRNKVSNVTKKIIAAPKRAVQSVTKQVKRDLRFVQTGVKRDLKRLPRVAAGVMTAGASEGVLLASKKSPLKNLFGGKKSGGSAPTTAAQVQYVDENGNPITKDQYDAAMAANAAAAASAPVTDPSALPGSTQSFDYGSGDESLTAPQPGGDAIMDPYGSPAEDFGPEDMGPAVEAESAIAAPQASATTTMDVSATGIEPFADEQTGFEDGGDAPADDEDATEGTAADAGPAYSDEDVTGDDEASYDESPAPRPRHRRSHKRRRSRSDGGEDLDTADIYSADDLDNEEDGGEGDDTGSAESPAVEGLPTVAGMGLGTLALLGIGAYLLLRK